MALKKTSEVIAISFDVQESAANTYTQDSVNLQLNSLDNEVFVVLCVDLDPGTPSAISNTNTAISMALYKTSQTAYVGMENNNTIAVAGRSIAAAGFADGGVGFTVTSLDSPPAQLDYVDILATNDFFVAIQGTNNAGAIRGTGRMWGFRAKADAATYAALVQSELLSA